jgi:hypothetical protein
MSQSPPVPPEPAEEELSMTRIGALVLIFAAGSILVFFPILTVLQALVVDRLRIRAK